MRAAGKSSRTVPKTFGDSPGSFQTVLDAPGDFPVTDRTDPPVIPHEPEPFWTVRKHNGRPQAALGGQKVQERRQNDRSTPIETEPKSWVPSEPPGRGENSSLRRTKVYWKRQLL